VNSIANCKENLVLQIRYSELPILFLSLGIHEFSVHPFDFRG